MFPNKAPKRLFSVCGAFIVYLFLKIIFFISNSLRKTLSEKCIELLQSMYLLPFLTYNVKGWISKLFYFSSNLNVFSLQSVHYLLVNDMPLIFYFKWKKKGLSRSKFWNFAYLDFIFHPMLMWFVSLNWLCWGALVRCIDISSISYGF
jgi:hypothetical protein